MRARYYDPEIKRFINRDVVPGTIAESQSLNRYAYTNGNPVSFIDPFGLAREGAQSEHWGHYVLDGLGLIPGIGEFADGINAVWYLAEGDYTNAALSAGAMIPVVGYAANGVKYADKINTASQAVKKEKSLRLDLQYFSAKQSSTQKIPTVRNGKFSNWFNSLSSAEFKALWENDPIAKQKIKDRLRRPGGYHEWLMVSRADKFKEWGVTAEEIFELRTLTSQTKFKNPYEPHHGTGAGTAHSELGTLIDEAPDYNTFIINLRDWADHRLEGGSQALPGYLKRP